MEPVVPPVQESVTVQEPVMAPEPVTAQEAPTPVLVQETPAPEAPVQAVSAPTGQGVKQTLDALTDTELTERWSTLKNPDVRKAITEIMQTRGIWPSASMKARDQAAGLYPDPDDPSFAARLFEKREFYESRALVAQIADGSIDPCTSAAANAVFELTPVQRLVSRFMHPLTPYLGLLLFHGVGVGKTCSAVTIAEQFLMNSPNKVIVLVPQAIQENFKKTIFDTTKLKWSGSWTTNQCTGVSYLERLGLLTNQDLKAVAFAVEADRRKRYTVTGYQAFANWIQRSLANHVPAGLEGEARTLAENEVLRKLFSDHLIIVDEAHNLRDVTDDETVVAAEAGENAGGKALNPFLKRIVLNAEGLRLVFMTATPMYNSAPEILRLLNFLIMNDTKREDSALQVADIFGPSGELRNGEPLESAARRYVSYMRGENPFTFPLRMRPAEATEVSSQWPTVSATKAPIVLTEFDRAALDVLPLVFTEPVAGSKVEEALRGATARGSLPEGEGEEGGSGGRDVMLDLRMQMANITYPNNMYGTEGWNTFFKPVEARTATRKVRTFAPKEDLSVFESGLEAHAPKIKRIVDSIISASGICFAYSRYIKAGALPLAVALERAGFQRRLADGSVLPLLAGVPPVAPICAICARTQARHRGGPQGGATMQTEAPETHPFSPAYYILLTSEDEISPDFPGLVRLATTWKDPVWGPMGTSVKAIIGSQVASEGLDLKCVREMHILDSWYHLNRTDQIIGRAIRYCSHSALRATEQEMNVAPMSYNNCLIYLHAAIVRDSATGPGFETADMYAYRLAIRKARNIGIVQRLLKKHAWDCNLEMEAIVFTGLPPQPQIDAQERELPDYSANDQDYTTYCDYQVCKHECAVSVGEGGGDSSTYRVADARRGILAKMDLVRHLFDDQVMIPESMVQEIFADLPWEIRSEALLELIDGKRFKIRRGASTGYLIKKAGFLIFQPIGVQDTDIPMALRYDRAFQLTRKFMTVAKPVFSKIEDVVVLDEEGPVKVDSSLGAWTDWLAFVNGGPLPSNIATTQRIWTWLRDHFSLPETRGVALRWFFDKLCTYSEQKSLIEVALSGNAELEAMLKGEFLKTSTMSAYRLFNPETQMVDYFCRSGSSAYGPCTSMIAGVVEKQLTKPALSIPEDVGTLVGFLAAKADRLMFKSLDTTKPMKSKTGGAECGNTSNLGEHHPRVRLLHDAGRGDASLAPFILPDADADWNEGSAKKHMAALKPQHMKDFTHQPLCLYMEFLTRLLDAKAVGGRRWFMSAQEAINAGLKSKKR